MTGIHIGVSIGHLGDHTLYDQFGVLNELLGGDGIQGCGFDRFRGGECNRYQQCREAQKLKGYSHVFLPKRMRLPTHNNL